MSESNYRPIGINYSNGKPTGFVELKDLVVSSISSFNPASGVVIAGKLIVNGDVSADNLAGIALPDFLSDLNQLVVDGYATGDQYLYFSAASAVALGTITNFGRQLASSTGTSQASSVLGLADFAFKSSLDFEELGNFSGPAPTGNQTLIYNDSAGRWVASTPPSVAAQYFSSLLDVSFTSPESSSVIYYDTGEKKWKNSQVRLYQLQTSDAADAKYLTQDNAAATYLSQSTAATTYLTQSSAATRYLSASDASTVYLKQGDAADTYLSQANAITTYLTQSSAATRYLSASDASNVYLTQSSAATRYLAASDATGIYLTQTNATNTYLSKSDAVTHYINASGDSANASFYFQNLSGTTFSATTLDLDNPLSINNGGTNTTATPNSSGIIYFDGTSYNSTDNIKFVNGDTLSATNLKLTNALPITQGGTAATATADARSNLGLAIDANVQGFDQGLKDLADLADDNPAGSFYPSYAAIPFIGFTGRYIKLTTGITAFTPPYPYRKVLRLFDPKPDLDGAGGNPPVENVVAEPRWEFLYLSSLENASSTSAATSNQFLRYTGSEWESASASLSGSLSDIQLTSLANFDFLRYNGAGKWINQSLNNFLELDNLIDVTLGQKEDGYVLTYDGNQWTAQPGGFGFLGNLDTSTTTPSAVSATYEYGSPFVWLFDKNDPKYSGYWGGLNLSSWVNTALRPKLDPVYINTSGDSASAGFYFSSVSSTTVSATTYLNLDPTLQALANQSTASNVLIYFSGVDLTASALFTSAGRKFCAVSSTLAAGDVFYYNGTDIVKLARPTYPAVLLIDNFTPTESGMPYWLEAPTNAPSQSYVLQVDTDGSNNPGAITWVAK